MQVDFCPPSTLFVEEEGEEERFLPRHLLTSSSQQELPPQIEDLIEPVVVCQGIELRNAENIPNELLGKWGQSLYALQDNNLLHKLETDKATGIYLANAHFNFSIIPTPC
jgi:hypothetical protein